MPLEKGPSFHPSASSYQHQSPILIMKTASILTISALGANVLAASIPAAAPPTSIDEAFQLKLRLVDKKRDLPSSMDNARVVINTFSGSDDFYRLVAVRSGHTRVFFLNGTKEEVAQGKGTILDDQTANSGNAFLGQDGDATSRPLQLSTIPSKRSDPAVALSPSTNPYSFLLPSTNYVVCPPTADDLMARSVQHPTTSYPIRSLNSNSKIPDGCVPVKIYPECSKHYGTSANRQYSQPARCYPAGQLPDPSK